MLTARREILGQKISGPRRWITSLKTGIMSGKGARSIHLFNERNALTKGQYPGGHFST